MPLSDRRRFPRFPFHSRAGLTVQGSMCRGTLLDISLGGALFAVGAEHADPLGQACELQLFQLDGNPLAAFQGIVAHRGGDTLFGIEFVAVGEREREALRQVIDLNLGTPTLLERGVPALLRPGKP